MKTLISSLFLLISAGLVHAENITCVFNSSVSGLQEKVTEPVDTNAGSFNKSLTLHGVDRSHFASVHLAGRPRVRWP